MKSLFTFATLALLVACSPNNPKMQPPPEYNAVVKIEPGALEIAGNSKVDILFVVDDSQSMAKHQENISKNIKTFTEEFSKNSLIDFHIGVTSAWDSQIKSVRDNDPKLKDRILDVNPLGHLLKLKDGNTGALMDGPRFVTKDTPNFVKVLEKTILVGAKPGPDQKGPTLGPMFEELFSPVRFVLSEPALSNENAGFYREDAFIVVFFITDANDAGEEDALSLKNFLLSLKGNNSRRVQPYAAIIPSGRECRYGRDKSGPPVKIEAFLDLFQNRNRRVLDLCSNRFGEQLAQFGKDIIEKIPDKVVEIDKPDEGSLHVYYGSRELDIKKHFDHEVDDITKKDKVRIFKNLKGIDYNKDAKIRVDFVPARTENDSNGRTRTF